LADCPLSVGKAPRELLLAVDQLLSEAAAEFFE